MDLEVLLSFFEKALSRYPELPVDKTKELLRESLLKRKDFDTQDEAIIEALIRDKDRLLEKSFMESVEEYIKKSGLENNLGDFLRSDEGQHKIVEIFISVLENLIDYFYNALLNKKFFTV
jgi:hypothetical protein